MAPNGEVPALGWSLTAAQRLLTQVIWDGLAASVAEGAEQSHWPVWNYVAEMFDDQAESTFDDAADVLRSMPSVCPPAMDTRPYGPVWRAGSGSDEPSPDERVGLTIAGLCQLVTTQIPGGLAHYIANHVIGGLANWRYVGDARSPSSVRQEARPLLSFSCQIDVPPHPGFWLNTDVLGSLLQHEYPRLRVYQDGGHWVVRVDEKRRLSAYRNVINTPTYLEVVAVEAAKRLRTSIGDPLGPDAANPNTSHGKVHHLPMTMPAQSRKVFISHAYADRALADAVTTLLRLGADITSDQIFCSSLDGMDVKVGSPNFAETIRKNLSDSELVVPLITSAFLDSLMCVAELGGMWALACEAFPIVVEPVSFDILARAIGPVQGARLNGAGLDNLYDRIVQLLRPGQGKTAVWSSHRAKFLANMPALLETLAQPTRVPVADLDQAKQRIQRLEEQLRVATDEVADLKNKQGKLIEAKTVAEAHDAVLPTGWIERFQADRDKAEEALGNLKPATREVVYRSEGMRRQWRPSLIELDKWTEHIHEAEQADELVQDDEAGVSLNRENPSVEAAVTALHNALSNVQDDEPLTNWFHGEYGETFTPRSRRVWVALRFLP